MAKKVTTVIDLPKKITIESQQRAYLVSLRNSPGWVVARDVANNYIFNLMKQSFKLPQYSPTFVVDHARLKGMADGIRHFIKAIEEVPEEPKEKE